MRNMHTEKKQNKICGSTAVPHIPVYVTAYQLHGQP